MSDKPDSQFEHQRVTVPARNDVHSRLFDDSFGAARLSSDSSLTPVQKRLLQFSPAVAGLSSSMMGSWREGASVSDLARLQAIAPAQWNSTVQSGVRKELQTLCDQGQLRTVEEQLLDRMKVRGALKGLAATTAAIGINQILDRTLLREMPYGNGSAVADLALMPMLGFLPCNSYERAGAMVAAHAGGRLFDDYNSIQNVRDSSTPFLDYVVGEERGGIVLRSKVHTIAPLVTEFTSAMTGSWQEAVSTADLAMLRTAVPQRWNDVFRSGARNKLQLLSDRGAFESSIESGVFNRMQLRGAIKGIAAATVAIGVNQILDHMVFRNAPYGSGSAFADLAVVPMLGFMPVNPYARAGLMIAAHAGGRLYDMSTDILRQLDQSIKLVHLAESVRY